MKGNYYINDKTDVFFWFSIIGETNAKRVLDIGGFLQRIGAVAPQVGTLSVPDGTVIDAINFCEKPMLPVYDTIYEHIFMIDKLPSERYDLAIFMTPADEWDSSKIMDVITDIRSKVTTLALDMPAYKRLQEMGVKMPVTLDAKVDEKMYKLVMWG